MRRFKTMIFKFCSQPFKTPNQTVMNANNHQLEERGLAIGTINSAKSIVSPT